MDEKYRGTGRDDDEQLLSDVWGYEYAGETRAVDMKISNLRKKLNLGDAIRAIPKLGYRLEER